MYAVQYNIVIQQSTFQKNLLYCCLECETQLRQKLTYIACSDCMNVTLSSVCRTWWFRRRHQVWTDSSTASDLSRKFPALTSPRLTCHSSSTMVCSF